jgi:hypothetical protein
VVLAGDLVRRLAGDRERPALAAVDPELAALVAVLDRRAVDRAEDFALNARLLADGIELTATVRYRE